MKYVILFLFLLMLLAGCTSTKLQAVTQEIITPAIETTYSFDSAIDPQIVLDTWEETKRKPMIRQMPMGYGMMMYASVGNDVWYKNPDAKARCLYANLVFLTDEDAIAQGYTCAELENLAAFGVVSDNNILRVYNWSDEKNRFESVKDPVRLKIYKDGFEKAYEGLQVVIPSSS